MFTVISRVSVVAMFLFILFAQTVRAQIAPGVLQSAAQTATVSGTVVQSDGASVPGADVKLMGPANLTTKSDIHGVFNFSSVPYGVYRLLATAPHLGTASRDTVVVKGDINVTIQYESVNGSLKEIARVSTHTSGANINVTPANIATVNPSEYAFQGNVSWKQLLDKIPGVTAGGNLYGGQLGLLSTPDNPLQPIILSINGALPYETSVTLDGMPLESSSFIASQGDGVDLGLLPMASFDAADVVRGPGANAPSIVDSIGGSFVLHGPGRVSANHFDFSIGNDAYGGILANAKAAIRWNRLSATVLYETYTSPGPFGNQSVIPASPAGYSTYGPIAVNGQAFSATGSYVNPIPSYSQCYCEMKTSLLYCCVPLTSDWKQHTGAVALSYDVSPSVTAQVYYAGSSTWAPQLFSSNPVIFAPSAGYAGGISPGTQNFIAADLTGAGNSIQQSSSLLEEKVTAYMGSGVLRLAAVQNNSFVAYNAPGPSFLPNGQYTLYGTGYYASAPSTPVNFNGTSATLTFLPDSETESEWTNNRDLLASYAVQIGSAVHAGVSFVSSYYNAPLALNENYAGFPYSFHVSTADAETTNELRLNFGSELSSKLSADASWYIAKGHYHVKNPNDPTGISHVDVNFPYSAPRIGIVWRANPNTAVRIAAGGGYALPPICYIDGASATYLYGPYYYEFATNLNLKPETSFGFDFGTDIRMHRDTVLSFDLYRTNLFGQFYESSTLTGTHNGLPLYIDQYGNLSQSRYEGVNLDIRHEVSKGVYWHGALGLTRAYVVSVPAGFYDSPSTGPNSANTYVVTGANFDGEFQSTVPYANGSATIGYRWSPGKYIDLSPTYYGKNNLYFVPAFVEFDAHAGYPLTRDVSLIATLRNLTGIYDGTYQRYSPVLVAPVIAGLPYPLEPVPYGPRTVIVTLNFSH